MNDTNVMKGRRLTADGTTLAPLSDSYGASMALGEDASNEDIKGSRGLEIASAPANLMGKSGKNFSLKNLLMMSTVALLTAANITTAAPPPSNRTADVAAVEGVGAAFVDDWNRHDMNSFGSLFADDAEFVNVIGLWWHGRAEIQKEHEALHGSRMRMSHLSATGKVVHLLGPAVAVLLQQWQLTGDTGIDGVTLPMRRGVMSLVTVKESGHWRIAVAQNTDIVPLPNLPPGK